MKSINIVGADWWYQQKDDNGHVRYRPEKPEFLNITHNKKKDNDITFFVNNGVFSVNEIESDIKIAIPNEQRQFVQNVYEFVEQNYNLFKYVCSYDDKLSKLPNTFASPYGNTFIWPPNLQQIYKKQNFCSYITSTKNATDLQKFRISVLDHILINHSNVHTYGRGHNPLPELDERGKIYGLKDYMFSVAIENAETDHYFSEKILDCFLTGTIPIYRGCRKLNNYFDSNGFFVFSTMDELDHILNSLTVEDYDSKISAVINNYFRALQYTDPLLYYINELKLKL